MVHIDKQSRRSRRRGFTLVEVMIVVVILGILASTVLPQFTSSSNDAKQSALVQNLQTLRSVVQLYQFQHNGSYPAAGSTSTTVFKNALLLSTNVSGTTGPAGTLPYGPYIVGQLPPNPYTGGRGVMIVNAPIASATPNEAAMDGTQIVGWIYSPSEGQIRGNNAGTASDGSALFSL